MSRELFPFFLLGAGHGEDTTGSVTTPAEKPSPVALTVGTVSRDFRPKNPDAHEYSPIPGNVKAAGDDPKASSAQDDATSSRSGSTDSLVDLEALRAYVEKDQNANPAPSLKSGSPEQPVVESPPNDQGTAISSSLLL